MIRIKPSTALCMLLASVITSLTCCKPAGSPPAAQLVKSLFIKELNRLQAIVGQKLIPAIKQADTVQIKRSFLEARRQYKRIEYYTEYFFPTTAVMINGAPVDEIELGENLIENPTGFQVMEGMIYSEPDALNITGLLNEAKKMQLNLKRIARFNTEYEITDAQIMDAARLEIFRITSLGITGFDTPDALQSLPEAAAALSGMSEALSFYEDDATRHQVKLAVDYLRQHNNYNEFNRLTFITTHLNPLNASIGKLRQRMKLPTVADGSALQENTYSLFQSNAFNINRFTGNTTEYTSGDKVQLGQVLFNDAILSNQNNRSCATCHKATMAFTDGLVKARAIAQGQALQRNTPTLTYAGLQRGFFYDLKAGSLEDQALDVVHHQQEMAGSLEQAAARINKSAGYRKLFAKAYQDSTGMANPWRIQHALASYIRSLAPFSSRFDWYMRGRQNQLTRQEQQGFNLFMGKAKCGSCHFAPLFNGTAPPLFNKSEAEVLGVPANTDTIRPKLDKDKGRFGLYDYPQYLHAFKTPTLRNINKTAPYMHNGVYKTLDEVLDFYNRGGGAGMGIKVDNQTLSADPLNLTVAEKKAVIAFLKSLDDR